MGKTGVDKEAWDSAVSKAESAVSSISKPSIEQLSKTTLQRFKKLIELQKTLADTVESFKSVSNTDTQKMKQAAENIVQEDKQAANAIQQNTAKVRFG